MIKVINFKYSFLESHKCVSQINLEASQISLGCGVCGDWRGGGRSCGGVYAYRGCYDFVLEISI